MAEARAHLSPPAPPALPPDETDRLLIDLHVARACIERSRDALREIMLDPETPDYYGQQLAVTELDQAHQAVTRAIGRRRAQL